MVTSSNVSNPGAAVEILNNQEIHEQLEGMRGIASPIGL